MTDMIRTAAGEEKPAQAAPAPYIYALVGRDPDGDEGVAVLPGHSGRLPLLAVTTREGLFAELRGLMEGTAGLVDGTLRAVRFGDPLEIDLHDALRCRDEDPERFPRIDRLWAIFQDGRLPAIMLRGQGILCEHPLIAGTLGRLAAMMRTTPGYLLLLRGGPNRVYCYRQREDLGEIGGRE
jgi:hypothetical protein